METQEKYRDNLFYNSSKQQIEFSKALRKSMTPAEKMLWKYLRNKKINGFHFRRQHPVGQFIADFYCDESKLVIEVDGEIHNTLLNKNYDNARNKLMSENEIKVIRFSNNEVLNSIKKVIEKIKSNLI